MVCMQQFVKKDTQIVQRISNNESINQEGTVKELGTVVNESNAMEFEDDDRLQLQHLAGSNIVAHPPLYAPGGEYLFIMGKKLVKVYSTVTGELTRQLEGASDNLISMEIELKQTTTLIACTKTGEVLRWKWATGKLENKLQLKFGEDEEVATFNLLNYYGNSKTPCAFVTVKRKLSTLQWFVVDTSTGARLNVPCNLNLSFADPLVAVDTKNFSYIVVAQEAYVYFIDYKAWQWRRLFNAHRVPVTVVRIHPTEDVVATGDETGKIFLWRQFMSPKTVTTSLYHWHHTAVTSIAFSASGASFYSSGLEAVLVKWNVKRTDLRNFIPRMCAIIRHIAVSDDNIQIAVCTVDNGVQILGNDHNLQSTLQEFTYIADDKTCKSKFPTGLRLNPRTNTLVLNGRTGHLQFYSVYTKHLLYNMDVVMQNRLSMESDKILYNISVTKAAFNIDWMATGEVFNDEEHLPELRLKFWKYQEESQSYILNTNVELPHEGGFKAIEFSNDYQVDNLLCATVGNDNTIKMWSLEESDNIYKQGKVWYCIAQTSYKDMPVESISFSQDGSLLAAGFGHTLCIYKADNLKLKAALNGSAGLDGCVQKAQVKLIKQNVNGSRQEYTEQRKKLLQLVTNLLENNDETIIKQLQHAMKSKVPKNAGKPCEKPLDELQRAQLYSKILQMHELNLCQKLLLFQRLGIRAQVHPQWQAKMTEYLRSTVCKATKGERTKQLAARVHRLNKRECFKAKYRLQQHTERMRNYDAEITQHLVPIMSVLNLSENCKPRLTNGSAYAGGEKDNAALRKAPPAGARIVPPVQTLAEISRVQFAAGEYAHLVIVCTEKRVLIWNLLTLRLQSALKLSIEHMAFDPQTNLIAAFTKNNDLHVFQPNVPLPIYQRRNMPQLYGATWLPRRHHKQRSLNLDWQAQSTLYFLTKSQEIMYLGCTDTVDVDAPPPITFANAAAPDFRYTTFGTYAVNKNSGKQSGIGKQMGPLVLGNSGKNAVRSLIEMATHTMPPLSLLCDDFVKSLVKPAESSTMRGVSASSANKSSTHNRRDGDDDDDEVDNGGETFMNGNAHNESDNDESEQGRTTNAPRHDVLAMRKTILTQNEEINASKRNAKLDKTRAHAQANTEAILERIAVQNIKLDL